MWKKAIDLKITDFSKSGARTVIASDFFLIIAGNTGRYRLHILRTCDWS